MTDRHFAAILLGTVAWIVALLILRLAFDALAVAPPAAASTPSVWLLFPPEAFSPVPRSDPATLGASPAGAATETPSQSEVSVHLPDASRAPSPSPTRTRPASTVKPPAPHPKPGALLVSGVATYYAYHQGQAAAGWALRRALGPGWRGMTVTVCGRVCLRVVLTDYESSRDHRKVIDLDSRDFALLAPLSRGVVRVEVSR